MAAGNKHDYGAVYLYSFSDSLFSGGNLEGIIGKGYTGGKNINMSLSKGDNFGKSVSLDGNQLGASAVNYDASTAGYPEVTYLFNFSDNSFNGGLAQKNHQSFYTGKNIYQALDSNDYFGSSVSLDGNRLAVGSPYDDGFNNSRTDSGAVYLYSFSDDVFSNGVLGSYNRPWLYWGQEYKSSFGQF
ncbi:MAG: FG-GAP repeat protein [Sphingobacterium sp.]|nr:FG-GAP repeat protein [Sphingobacterium sp.]